MKSTFFRDITVLIQRRTFWWALAVWMFICALIFFAYVEDFLAIQPQLRAKAVHYGITDILIVPYIQTLSFVALAFMIALCARLFHNEHFADFSKLYRSTQPRLSLLIGAKLAYIAFLALLIIGLLALPPLVSSAFLDFNLARVVVTLLAQFVLLFTVGLIAMVLSQCFRHSILVMLVSGVLILSLELMTRLLVDPAWIAPLIAFFSPIAHMNRIATGMMTLSDGVFFIVLWLILCAIAIRQFNNTYLTTS